MTLPRPMPCGWQNLWLCLALSVLTLAVFGQATGFDFINFDDPQFISENPKLALGLSPPGLRWAFTANLTEPAPGAEYWEPLTLLTRLADFQWFGLQPGGHHLTGILIHLAAGLVLFGASQRLLQSRGRAAVVAAIFLIHPLHVEPVAWLSARKDVLNGLFYFLTIWAYAWYAARPGWARYLAVFASFLCANMAKPMAVSLPLVLLLLDYWPLRRLSLEPEIRWRTLGVRLLEKLPLFLVAAGVSLLTWIDQRNHGAVGDGTMYPWSIRAGNAALGLCQYLLRTLLPVDLAVFYPHPGTALNGWAAGGAFLFLLAITAFCLWRIKSQPWLFVGWGWFGVVLLPVSGLIQIGDMARADRYSYVAQTGLILIAVSLPWLRERRRGMAAAGASLAVFALLSWQQTATWRNSLTVFGHALEVTDENFVAEANYGSALFAAGQRESGRKHLANALRIRRPVLEQQLQAGLAAERRGDVPAALLNYGRILTLTPWNADLRLRCGSLLLRDGQPGQALSQFREALRYQREFPATWLEIARAFQALHRPEDARRAVQEALRIEPGNLEAPVLLALLPSPAQP